MRLQTQPATRASAARPMLLIVLLVQALHAASLVFLPNPLIISNVLQLLCGTTAVWVCASQVPYVVERAGRLCWRAIAVAFAIWSSAQLLFLLLLCFPRYNPVGSRVEDLLWTIFGLPILLAVNTFMGEESDRVLWLDRMQGVVFFAVLYLGMFLPSVKLSVGTLSRVQEAALLLGCLLRLPTAATDNERRFFMRLSLYLCVYTPASLIGDTLHDHGHPPGGLVDLAWTVPTTFFCVLVLWHANRPRKLARTERVMSALRSMQGLSASCLALLSIVVSAYLAIHAPLPGGICIALSFGLFALRTNARENAWIDAHGKLEVTVLRDALTGLGNRLLLRQELEEHLGRNEADIVLIFVDLDHFKNINDTLGHGLGDCLLVEVARRLSAAAPPQSVICRLGGDEFVVLTMARSAGSAEQAGAQILAAFQPPFHLAAHQLRCTASIGVVLAAKGENPDDLLRTADHAMYRAKQLGKDRVQFFDPALRSQLTARWQMETELRACIEAGSIQVAFQPIYSVEEAGICGFEALARWSHPVLGNVPPVEFITLAEESGLILPLGAQILEKGCAQMAFWNRSWGTSLSLSVNVSPRQFADADLIPKLLAILERTGYPPTLLRLEITETALLTQETVVKQTLEQARAHGIRISLDDFGTGYSSLSFLLSLPVDEVKVDRSFVSHMHRDPDREEVVRTVIRLGHSLGKRVVAEGVETEEDLRGLKEMGCECVQGYLISKPLLADAMEGDFPSIAARSRNAAAELVRLDSSPTQDSEATTLVAV